MSRYNMILRLECPDCHDGIQLLSQTIDVPTGKLARVAAEATLVMSGEHRCIARLAEMFVDEIQREQGHVNDPGDQSPGE